jgi:sialate O-acetylesterase
MKRKILILGFMALILSFAQADSTGSWYVKLPKSSLGEAKTITINNVLLGYVWMCSGQSNMEWRVSQSKDPKKESAAANYPNILYF